MRGSLMWCSSYSQWRAARFYGDDAFDEFRAVVGEHPAEGTGLRMREQYRRADPVEQRNAGLAIELLDHADIGDVFNLR